MSVTRIEVPATSAVDAPLTIIVRGVEPGREVTLRTTTVDSLGRTWHSQTTRTADVDGTALFGDFADAAERDAPDALRVLGSLRLDEPTFPPLLILMPPASAELTLTAFVDGTEVASGCCARATVADSVQRSSIDVGDLPGVMFEPAEPLASVLLVSGSGGGLLEPQAALLAGHGFTVLTLAYFALPDLPPTLTEIELARFDPALQLLAERAPSGRVAIAGTSRGGELALLLAARRPTISAAAAYAPSAYVHSGVGRDSDAGTGGIVDAPAWLEDGEPLPFLGPSGRADIRNADGVLVTTREYLAQLEDPDPRAAIPVEQIAGPVFVAGAGDDAVWPSGHAAQVIERRLAAHPWPVEVVTYPKAGHGLAYMIPHVPTSAEVADPYAGNRMAWGGSTAADADARADAWPRLVAFLRSWAQA